VLGVEGSGGGDQMGVRVMVLVWSKNSIVLNSQ